jgi:hypothetical protein
MLLAKRLPNIVSLEPRMQPSTLNLRLRPGEPDNAGDCIAKCSRKYLKERRKVERPHDPNAQAAWYRASLRSSGERNAGLSHHS